MILPLDEGEYCPDKEWVVVDLRSSFQFKHTVFKLHNEVSKRLKRMGYHVSRNMHSCIYHDIKVDLEHQILYGLFTSYEDYKDRFINYIEKEGVPWLQDLQNTETTKMIPYFGSGSSIEENNLLPPPKRSKQQPSLAMRMKRAWKAFWSH